MYWKDGVPLTMGLLFAKTTFTPYS